MTVRKRKSVPARSKQVTHAAVLRVIEHGFLLVTLLMVAAGIMFFLNIRSIRSNVAELVEQEVVASRLLDDVQHEQAALSAIFHRLSRDPANVDRERMMADLDEADGQIRKTRDAAAGAPEAALWNQLADSSRAFSTEARRLLSLEDPPTLLSRDLFRRHEESLSIVAKLAAASHARAASARAKIDQVSEGAIRNSAVLLGASVLLALLCAILTIRMALSLLRKMEWQAGELSRVSWHMLENQETAARRFSHELHDELGQSLAAVKANLVALESQPETASRRLGDSLSLVDGAIQNVRELSQLMHPTILDDFGLDAALRWLAERFRDRTGLEVNYTSNLDQRLPVETETQLFRICQESLTNVARHAGASRVEIELHRDSGRVTLTIADNGKGLPDGVPSAQGGVGLIGMRARARSAGGEVVFRSSPGRGLTVRVDVPLNGTREARVPDLAAR